MDPTAHTVEARDGLSLNCWEQSTADATEAVLFLHGSITCARALFAPPVPGDDSYSWLAATADAGRAAFALDVRGYGDSERPPELDEPPEANGPPVRTDLAANDVADAFAFVRESYDVVHLVGVSWGTNTCGRFVERNDPDVASLTQVAPVYDVPYDVEEGLAALGLDADFGAYHYQEYDTVKDRQGETGALFEAIWRTQVESNQGVDGERYLAQTGALADYDDCGRGNPPYDAAALDLPTLVVRGSEDVISVREDATTLYDELGTEEGEYLELAGGDHYLMHGARRAALYDAVAGFQDRA
ncbi:alpha/beta hydrolase [Halomarina ordinaria]|uniref:Alpha/beta hydrolase n=1 Tax=Halomarina ordinaria TaxID=3033939 RepID=A0ABD5U8X0_9EURY|nr:alpha/beta fold hydrolase [Halomarina sp. PSRA2]